MSEILDDRLCCQNIKNKLNDNYEIEVLPVTDSTNTYLKELAKKNNSLDKYIVIAEKQTDGRGRFGRSFISPDGEGLYMSILLRPELSFEDTALLTIAAAVSVCEAIEKLTNCNTDIKWVNDILINGKKVCGILSESSIDCKENKISFAVVGVGINVNMKTIPVEIRDIATSLEKENKNKISRNALASEIINTFDKYAECLTERKYIDYYRKKSVVLGKNIKVVDPDGNYQAKAVDIDDNGCLIIESDNKIKTLNSGEISVKL